MSLTLSPSIVTNGLLFNYDMNNTKSFKGAPATNLVSSAAAFSGWNNYWRTDYINTFTTEFGTTGYRISGNPSWNGVYRGITLPSTGTYTFSAWFRYWGGTSSNNGAQVYVSGWGGGDSATGLDKSLIGVWQRVSITLNCTGTSPTFYIISYGGDSSGRADCSTWDVTMPQVESGSYATGFVDGTRSNTQAVLDLTNTNTVTANSLTYANDGTFSFNGSASYIDSGTNIPSTTTFTLSCWVKPANSQVAYSGIMGNHGSGGTTGIYCQQQYTSLNNYHWGYGNGSSWGTACTFSLTSNLWHHLVLVKDGTYNYAYVNGLLVNSVATNGTPAAGGFNISFGRDYASDRYFNGSISSGQIYNRPLSASEVLQNFNAQRGRYGV